MRIDDKEIIETLLEKYAFSTGNAFIVLAKDIAPLIKEYLTVCHDKGLLDACGLLD